MKLKKGLLYRLIEFSGGKEPENICELITSLFFVLLGLLISIIFLIGSILVLSCMFLAIGNIFISYPESSFINYLSLHGIVFFIISGVLFFGHLLDKGYLTKIVSTKPIRSMIKIIEAIKNKTCLPIKWEDK
jgi:hypothetical protein